MAKSSPSSEHRAAKKIDSVFLTKNLALEIAVEVLESLTVRAGHGTLRDPSDRSHHLLYFGDTNNMADLIRQAAGGTGFIDDVDGFIRKMAVIDVPGGQLGRSLQGLIGVGYLMVAFVMFA